MKGLYLANPKSGNGYQFGLMLEAMGDFDEAAHMPILQWLRLKSVNLQRH